MCAIFGKLGELGRTKGRNQLIAEAMDIVGAAKLGASTRLMAEALEWLLLEDNKRLKETGNTTLPAILHAAVGCDKSRHGVVKALNNIKYALFSPFKPDTHKWHPLALKLLVKHGALKGANLQFIKQVTINDSPVSYASILAFLRDLTIALKSDSRQLTDIKLESSETVTLTCIWNTDIVGTDSSMVDCKFIRKTLSRIIRFPREWRVESANYGDIIRPFIMLANKMLGLNEDKGWQAYTMAEHDVVALQKPNEENIEQMRNFSISCEKNKVIINWTIL
jgi:hypothetical protein